MKTIILTIKNKATPNSNRFSRRKIKLCLRRKTTKTLIKLQSYKMNKIVQRQIIMKRNFKKTFRILKNKNINNLIKTLTLVKDLIQKFMKKATTTHTSNKSIKKMTENNIKIQIIFRTNKKIYFPLIEQNLINKILKIFNRAKIQEFKDNTSILTSSEMMRGRKAILNNSHKKL